MKEESVSMPSVSKTTTTTTQHFLPTSTSPPPLIMKKEEHRQNQQRQQNQTLDRPPMNVVFIRGQDACSSLEPSMKTTTIPTAIQTAAETTMTSATNAATNTTQMNNPNNQPLPPHTSCGSFSATTTADSLSSSPFKLKPRYPMPKMCSPSTSIRSSEDCNGGNNNSCSLRGGGGDSGRRKRRAYTLSLPIAHSTTPTTTTTTTTTTTNSCDNNNNTNDNNDKGGEKSKTPPRPNRRRPLFRESNNNNEDSSSNCESTPSSGDGTDLCTPPAMYYHQSSSPSSSTIHPPLPPQQEISPVFMSLQNLSLYSSPNPSQLQQHQRNSYPFAAAATVGGGSSHLHHQRMATSSFSVYSGSPQARSSIQQSSSGSTSSSIFAASRTPCSSARSSPRQVPLTVLSNTCNQVAGSPAAMATTAAAANKSSNIPPLFNVGRMPFIDSKSQRKDEPNGTASTTTAAAASLLSSSSPRKQARGCHQDSPGSSSGSRKHEFGVSPRSQVPKLSLTPRTPLSLTPRSQGSKTSGDGRSNNGGLPRFPMFEAEKHDDYGDFLCQPKLDLDDDDVDDECAETQQYEQQIAPDMNNKKVSGNDKDDADFGGHDDDAIGRSMDSLLLSFAEQKNERDDVVSPPPIITTTTTTSSAWHKNNNKNNTSIGDCNVNICQQQGPKPYPFHRTSFCESSNSLAFSADGSTTASPCHPGGANSSSRAPLVFTDVLQKESPNITLESEPKEGEQKIQQTSFLPRPSWHSSPTYSPPSGIADLTFPSHLSNSTRCSDVNKNEEAAEEENEEYGTPKKKNHYRVEREVMVSGMSRSLLHPSNSKNGLHTTVFHAQSVGVDHQGNYSHHSQIHDQELEGSLSDSDDEFILADPIAIAEEKQDKSESSITDQVDLSSRRVKQRCNRSVDTDRTFVNSQQRHNGPFITIGGEENVKGGKGDSGFYASSSSSTVDSFLPNRASSSSLSPAGDPTYRSTSNASLFGMDIVLEESSPKWTVTATTSKNYLFPPSLSASKLSTSAVHGVSSGTLTQKDSNGAFSSSGSLSQKRSSEHSLGSLGLPLDGFGSCSNDDTSTGRDLVTPPVAIRSTALSPPPLHPQTLGSSSGLKI